MAYGAPEPGRYRRRNQSQRRQHQLSDLGRQQRAGQPRHQGHRLFWTAEDPYQGGSTFYVHVKECMPVSGKAPSKLTVFFSPLSGSFATGSTQIFANDDTTGAKNVGVVIFSVNDANNVYNVMNTDGTPRSSFDVTAANYADSRYSFYARMQKIQSGQSIVSGPVKSSVLVSVYYE